MVVIRPSGSVSVWKASGYAQCSHSYPQRPPTAQSSCEVTELQLNLRWSGKRKLLFLFIFLTMILNVHGWFDFKGTLSDSLQWTVE